MSKKVSSVTSWDWDRSQMFRFYSPAAGGGTEYFDSAQHFVYPNQVIRGDSPRDWKQRIKQGTDATSTLEGERYTANINRAAYATRVDSLMQGGIEYKRTYLLTGSINRIGLYAGPPGVDTSLEAVAHENAIREFTSHLINAQRAVSALTSLGEIGQTLRMIRHPADALQRGLYSYLDSLKKKGKKRKKRMSGRDKSKMIADTWLEYAFGWAPLISDIDGSMKALSRINCYHAANEVVSGKANRDTKTNHDISNTYPSLLVPAFTVNLHGESKTQSSVKFHGRVSIDEPNGPSFEAGVWGSRIKDIVPTLWELIPYSFLVDYFLPVGKTLEAWSINKADIKWCVKGTKTSSVFVHRINNITFGDLTASGWKPVTSYWGNSRESVLTYQRVSRSAFGGSLVPPLRFGIPGVFSKQTMNMAALLLASKRTSAQLSAY